VISIKELICWLTKSRTRQSTEVVARLLGWVSALGQWYRVDHWGNNLYFLSIFFQNFNFLEEEARPNLSEDLSNGRILKENLSWILTRAKFCQLIESLFVFLHQLLLTKFKLKYLKFDLKCKKEKINKDEKFLHHSILIFFRDKLKFAFRVRSLETRQAIFPIPEFRNYWVGCKQIIWR